jgi:uncharacterized protein YbjT (DUF2867 family)
MTQRQPFLVLGATDGQSGAVCEALLRRGAPARAYVRNPASASADAFVASGVELAAGTLNDGTDPATKPIFSPCTPANPS